MAQNMEEAKKMFRDARQKNAVTWNALTTSYDTAGLCDYRHSMFLLGWNRTEARVYLMSCYKMKSANYCKPSVVV
jgi:hypothetical protein